MKFLILLCIFFSLVANADNSNFFWKDKYEVKKLPNFLECMTQAEKNEAKVYKEDYSKLHNKHFIHNRGSKNERATFNRRLGKAEKLKKWICVPSVLSNSDSAAQAEFVDQMEISQSGSRWNIKVKKGHSRSNYGKEVVYKVKSGKSKTLYGNTASGAKITMRPLIQDGSDSRFLVLSFYGNGHILCYQEKLHGQCNPFHKKNGATENGVEVETRQSSDTES